MAIKICLDAGHYGKTYNRSPIVREYYESEMNWKLHLKLKAELEKRGFEVITTRRDQEEDLSLYDRGRTAKGCDLFMSLHSNAAYSTSEVKNGEVHAKEYVDRVDIYALLDGRAHDLAKRLADRIHEVMGTDQGGFVKTKDNGKGGEYYGVLRGAAAVDVPGFLVEHSFHTNRRAAEWLLKDENLDRLAEAEAEVLAAYYGATGTPAPDQAPTERMLRKGDEGDDVAALQDMLLDLGYDLGRTGANKDGVDGDFGAKTDAAVRDFQKKNGLSVDGIVGPKTYAALRAAEAETAEPVWHLIIEGSEDKLKAIQAEHGGELVQMI